VFLKGSLGWLRIMVLRVDGRVIVVGVLVFCLGALWGMGIKGVSRSVGCGEPEHLTLEGPLYLSVVVLVVCSVSGCWFGECWA